MNRRFITMVKQAEPSTIGDVFVIQPYLNVFVYGKVIDIHRFPNTGIEGNPLIVITRAVTRGINKNLVINTQDILIEPFICNKYDFRDGNLMIIRNDKLSPVDEVKYGYMNTTLDLDTRKLEVTGQAMNPEGKPLGYEPEYIVRVGILGSISLFIEEIYNFIDNCSDVLQKLNIEPYTDFADEIAKTSKKHIAAQTEINEINSKITPFLWVNAGRVSVIFNTGDEFRESIFETSDREGSGYDWEALAKVFIIERAPELKGKIKYDSEAGMFCALGSKKALKEFAYAFRDFCEDKTAMMDLLSRAEFKGE